MAHSSRPVSAGRVESHTILGDSTATAASESLQTGWVVLLLALGAGWILFFKAVSGEWQVNPQYGYGYTVPVLGLAVLWRRWVLRPRAEMPCHAYAAALVSVVLLLAVFPWMLALEANPEWRFLYWFSGIQMVGLSLAFLYRAGGRAWAGWFAPPLLFMLVSAPWPMEFEQAIVQNLMRVVAGLTVSVSDVLGIPAVQHGNLVEVGAGVIGIDEACSGVRSLQSALMLSLFLGELYLFSWGRRLALLSVSILLVLLANLGRTSFLVWAAASRGLHQMEAWHDMAGQLVMWISLPSLFALGWWMRPKGRGTEPTPLPYHAMLPPLPGWIGIAVLVWLGLSAAATEVWYRVHESTLITNPRWGVAWPGGESNFNKSVIPEKSLAILRCSSSDAASWRDDAGNTWSAFLLRWEPGRNSAQLAKGHRPDICFPAAGARLDQNFGWVVESVKGLELAFRHQSFDTGGSTAHVFYCLWSDCRADHEPLLREDGSQASRVDAILAGKRNLGQQVFEVVVRGPESSKEAEEVFRNELPRLIRLM